MEKFVSFGHVAPGPAAIAVSLAGARKLLYFSGKGNRVGAIFRKLLGKDRFCLRRCGGSAYWSPPNCRIDVAPEE
jgi:hypothetical protein